MSAIAFAVRAGANLSARMPWAEALLALCALGVVNTGAGFWLFYTLIAEAGAGRASVIT